MNLLFELFSICEKATPGLDLSDIKVKDGKIIARINGKLYEFTPSTKSAGEIYNSVVGVAKHSPGRALIYLKKQATGVQVSEGLSEETS